jgi:hypothetical protein
MISFHEIGLAYRKAKVDLYYSSHPSLDVISDYEENLHKNLSVLLERVNGDDESWAISPDFIGTWTLATKSVDMSVWKEYRRKNGNGLIFASPEEEWEQACSLLPPKTLEAQFRVMAHCSIDFHILSTLWLLKVGHLFDAKLTTCAYGNRLRRTQSGEKVNELSLGSFEPYLKPFRDWRDNGIRAMRDALDENKKIIALTADVSSFYHKLNPGFMLDSAFVKKVLNLELTIEQAKIHRLFIHALQAWALGTPLEVGLPVGLPASAIVANMALIELDRVILQQVAPLYYGRYVDDILLVMENGAGFRSAAELWTWLFDRSGEKLFWADVGKLEISFSPEYLGKDGSKSEIHFSNAKNKVFMLAGEPGKTLVDAIVRQIYERASEWRAMPRLPHSATHVGTDLVAATQSDGEAADNLRKADALTMRRAGFAIKLRDFEAYERDLLPEIWEKHRRAFLSAFRQHVLVLPYFFDLSVYLPRVIRLATACEDFGELRKIVEDLEHICREVRKNCNVTIKAFPDGKLLDTDEAIDRWQSQLFNAVHESITAAFPPRLTKAGTQAWQKHMSDYRPALFFGKDPRWHPSVKSFQRHQARLFSFDLAHMPFRFIGLPKEMIAQRGIPAKGTVITCRDAAELLPDAVTKGAEQLARWTKLKGLPNGLIFATRPFNLAELSAINSEIYSERALESMRSVVLSARGFHPNKAMPCFDRHGVLQVPDGKVQTKFGIAVSSWKTSMDSWAAAVSRLPDPDLDRYARLNRLLDGVIAQPQHSRYLILPELALPAHWFIRIARKLQGRGISLITGVEYLHVSRSRVRNQIWASLSHDSLGFPSIMIYRQDKQRPALHEEQELHRLAGLEMRPEKAWREPPILQHGDFRFALMICSELTNISYRAALRGKVDALFVPEWNQDTESFNALVESAALDVHAFIIQCNDRQYGDSRIRAPFKDSWKRDVLRVKGGVTDYCVIGQIDVLALRRFQSSYRSPAKPFKPVPDGFEISHGRKVLAVGEVE